MAGPFADLRIVDFSQGVGGPLATMLFADLGADVLKVEPPAGDRAKDEPGYLCWNRNKRLTTLDLHTYEGLREARRLVAAADVAVFDVLPGELERLGLDATTCLAANPRLIHAWLPPYGTEGRWSHLPPDELLLTAVSGVAAMQYSFEDQPIALVTPQVGYAQGTITANGIAAALWERTRSGKGQAITVSGLHAVSSIESGGAVSAEGMMRLGGRSSRGGVPHYRLYECADGEWFFLGTLTPPFFLKALEATDMLDLMALPGVDGEFANLFQPPMSEEVQQRLEARFREKPREEWLRILHEAGVPRGPVGKREEWFRSETVAANEMRLTFEHPAHGTVEVPGVPVKFSETQGEVRHLPSAEVRVPSIEAWPEPRPAPEPRVGWAPYPFPRPLQGVRVLDLGAFIAGTFAPTVLANYGADVIKIEPTTGDPFRTYGLIFIGHNLGKRSLAIDLKHPDGREVFLDLVRQSDVVLDNFRLGVRERLGIDYASLSAINPRIITCSVTGYGPKGPLAADPGFDPLLQARSGMMAAQGGDDEPVFHQIAINDSATAMMAAFGIQAALHARERTGRGQEVHTCLTNQTIIFQSGEVTWYDGRRPSPVGGRDFIGPSAVRRFYQCADGWICIAAQAPQHFHGIVTALGHPEWAGRWIADHALTEPATGELGTVIADALRPLPRAEALDRLRIHGVPAAPSVSTEELFDDPWLHANNFFQQIEDPGMGAITTVRAYADWSRSLGGFPHRAPQCGEHSREILSEFGFEDDRIDALAAAGVIAE
ncbi:MAG: CoA transferase [Dehalococcoidia bacterium]|nr:CoA transferase [Dehalococcoidia bacterium]